MATRADTAESTTLKQRTRQIARELLARTRALGPSVLKGRWWDERLMQWSMSQPELKVRLFRLVDVLPALRGRTAVLEHLREYLGRIHISELQAGEPDQPVQQQMIMRALRLSPLLIGDEGTARGWISDAAVNGTVRRLARRFIAGESISATLRTVQRLRKGRSAFSLDLLGEKVVSEAEADAYAEHYLRLIDALGHAAANWPPEPLLDFGSGGRPLPLVNLSIKLTSLYSQFDPLLASRSADAVLGRLRPILRAARRAPDNGAFINIDMEHYEVRDLTLAIFERVAEEDDFADWRNLGIVVQTYLKDSRADLQRIIDLARRRGTPVTVRLVKGAYWDHENVIAAQRAWPVPVFAHKHQTDANYERLTRMMLDAGDAIDPAFASHNVRSLAHALAYDEVVGLPPAHIEFQTLYGMGESIQAALVERGQRVRVYAPYGELIPGMAYLIRRLLENTANESFLRQSYLTGIDEEQLLADPAEEENLHASEPDQVEARTGGPGHADRASFRNCPDTDFSKEDNRVAMKDAIEQARTRLPRECFPIVGGMHLKGERMVERENPASPSELVARVALADQADADAAIGAAEGASRQWAAMPVRQRAGLLDRLGDLLSTHRNELAAIEVFETAKQWREADADISEAIDYCRYYATAAVDIMDRPRHRDLPGERNVYRYLPRGVGLIVSPWNFPLAILAGMSTAALATGNTVILKPSANAMAIAGLFAELAGQAGFPPGVVNYLPCQGSTVGQYMVCHPGVDFIAFTGSRSVGLNIYASAAANPGRRGPKRVICEMGGKNAIIIDADADLDDAVRGVVQSAFGYNGQKCSACSRAIVVGDAYPRFIDRLIEAAASVTIGPPDDAESFMGPVIDKPAFKQIREYIDIGKSEARCALETDVSALGDGYYVGPTIFVDVPPSARIAREEIFGPVLAVMRAKTFEEAIDLANGVDFALTGGVYSRHPGHVELASERFRVGNLYINRKITGALVDRQPFGGFKFSGLGTKAGGPDYLMEFVVPQTVTENTVRHGFAPETEAEKVG